MYFNHPTENPDWVKEQGKKSIDLDDRLKQVYVTSTEPEVNKRTCIAVWLWCAIIVLVLYYDIFVFRGNYAQLEPLFRPGTEHIDPSASSASRPLPLDRKPVDNFEYGYKEPPKVPRGRATLRQALQFIADHQKEPGTWTAKRIADDYKLKQSIVGECLQWSKVCVFARTNKQIFPDDILHNFHAFEISIPNMKTKESVLISQPTNKLLSLAEEESNSKPKAKFDNYVEMEEELRSDKQKR